MDNFMNGVFAFLFCMIPIIVFKIKDCIPNANKKTHLLMTLGWASVSLLFTFLLMLVSRSTFKIIPTLITIAITSIYNYFLMENEIDAKNLVKMLIIFLLFMMSSYLQLIPIAIFNIDLNNLSMETSTWLTVFSDAILLMILFLIYRKDLIRDFKDFRHHIWENMDVAIKYWLIGLIIMGTSNVLITFLATGAQASNEMGVQTMIHGAPLASFLAAGILAPIIEELTFRKSFFDALKNKWLFILTSGLIFGGLHVISATSWQDFLFIIPYSSLGVAFAAMVYNRKNILTSISMHMIHNVALILLSIATMAVILL